MKTDEAFERAVSLIDGGELTRARDQLAALAATAPAEPAVWAKLGEVHWDLEQPEQASECFRRATKLAPRSETASLALFHCLWELDQRGEALDEAKRFMSLAESEEYRDIIRSITTSAEA